jgi:tRNA(Ile2)-agmatinylcytidine synthase
MITLHVGIDDTDSPRMGCTTYVASLLVEKLETLGVSFVDYPNLIRLNPNVPWKTRGNGALCLRFKCEESQVDQIREIVLDTVERNSDMTHSRTDPGVAFLSGDKIPGQLTAFAKEAIQSIVRMKTSQKLIDDCGGQAFGFKSGRGIIGALAAVGETLSEDHTFEMITYRTPTNYGTVRRIDAESVFRMNEKTEPLTFNNVDLEKRRIVIAPHGSDPILYGVRGKTAEIVRRAHQLIRCGEPVERWTIFRTNQGTDAHLRRVRALKDIRAHHPVVVTGAVCKAPRAVPRRHVVFAISDSTGQVDCAAYEPTGDLRKKAARLIVGDVIEACGGVRPMSEDKPLTVNLEKFKVLRLATKLVFHNPLCPKCSKRMESMGSAQGFRCNKCGFRSGELRKQAVEAARRLERKLYVTSPRSQRHLTKPLSRYGLENTHWSAKMVSPWFWVKEE